MVQPLQHWALCCHSTWAHQFLQILLGLNHHRENKEFTLLWPLSFHTLLPTSFCIPLSSSSVLNQSLKGKLKFPWMGGQHKGQSMEFPELLVICSSSSLGTGCSPGQHWDSTKKSLHFLHLLSTLTGVVWSSKDQGMFILCRMLMWTMCIFKIPADHQVQTSLRSQHSKISRMMIRIKVQMNTHEECTSNTHRGYFSEECFWILRNVIHLATLFLTCSLIL